MFGSTSTSHKHSRAHSRSNSYYNPTSFLFVVNRLRVRLDENLLNGDPWYNRVPPNQPSGFTGEIPSYVMRYQNGQVTTAHGYGWWRGDFLGTAWPPGYVCLAGADGNPVYTDNGQLQCAERYKELAVFSCNPLLPIVVDNGDPLSTSAALDRSPLLFFHPPSQPGVSQAVHPDSPMGPGPAPCKYVAGTSPSWIPSLVPKTYRNPYNAVASVGLAGELPIVLGLMAFSELGDAEDHTSVTQTFLGDNAARGRWNGGFWNHTATPKGYALSTGEDPRGFFISIYLDPDNPDYSTAAHIAELEWRGILVWDNE
ncbi:hypothetical protein M441DRAFT_26145 [Trichoderma asperellum CBS 433.97]|uniref:Uncharacterized protein n=1 Tax=Trichoderma asperellum (strain ATCC 204424 / CBS 433.97 / NBRC 101777) TaxID=1042311 RepID=A0A2T3ZC61_TRIA4|nr:hypothetical protein M441DRAFT_26145 [Trichoderma asperellum CBS 433.97]PTB42396.1 hypothetical protein M441DRAFT_26145 [Trichoderma asperellum CBS 433.97]